MAKSHKKKTRPKRRFYCAGDDCGRMFWSDDYTDTSGPSLCTDCAEEADEPPYGIYGDREDQISYDSAMFRD